MEELRHVKVESVLLDRCKCCLGDGELKNMWEEHWWEGNIEIYGEMLSECFSLTLHNIIAITQGSQMEWICESCIVRLRAALEFKREVLACEQLRFENLNSVTGTEIKQEVEDNEQYAEYLNEEMIDDDVESYETSPEIKPEVSDDYQEFEDVEYLEIDEDNQNIENVRKVETNAEEVYDDDTSTKTPEPETNSKPKWSKRNRGVNRIFVYKQYTIDEMQKAIDAVESGVMKARQASKKYNIPIKTLQSKLVAKNQLDKNHRAYSYQFVEEVKKFLTYTNAVPFKTRSARYFCAYCSTDGPCFEEPEDLRIHTRTQHVDDRTKNIEIMLRPRYLNEVLKVDIDSLHCTVCCIILTSWGKAFEHLEERHNIELNESYTRLIPYILDRELKCALCSEVFPNYHNLDAHMNSHYSTYICQDCGDTFLSSSRMAKHVKVHITGRFPCQECGKVFSLHKYRQKHYDHVHKQEQKNKCLYCPEKFHGIFQRHLHVVEKHKEKVKAITCEICGLRFEWRPYYIAHLRRKHHFTKRYISQQ